MKIVHVCGQFRPAVNGLTNYVHYLTKIQARQHSVWILTSDKLNGTPFKVKRISRSFEYSRNRVVLRCKVYPPLLPYFWTYAMIPCITNHMKLLDYDVLHVHSYMQLQSDVALLLGKFKKRPTILTIHAYGRILTNKVQSLFSSAYNASAVKMILRIPDKIIVLDEGAKTYFSRFTDSSKIEVVPVGLHYDVFASPDIDPEAFRKRYNLHGNLVMFVGLLQERKGVQHLIRAASSVMKEIAETRLVIVGDGPYRRHLEKLSRNLGLSSKVRFLGFLPKEELIEAYKAASVLVLPSAYEGLPTVVLEAMASGTPVIATEVGGLPELIKNGKTGLLTEYANVEDLASTISSVLEGSELRLRMSYNARMLVRDYDWSVIAERIEKIYLEAFGARK